MVFDATAYTATVNDYRRRGDMSALEQYLTGEVERLREAAEICAGGSCCCGKDRATLEREDAEWQHNREHGLVTALSDLADLYRGSGAWVKCLQAYEDLRLVLVDAGLEGTPAYASALVNAAYACLDATDPERAARLLGDALCAIDESDEDMPVNVLRARAHDAMAVSWAMRGFGDQAAHEAEVAADSVAVCAAAGEDFIGALSNHVATLAQIGQADRALAMLAEALDGADSLETAARYTLMNLKAMVLYRAKRFSEAGDTLSELIDLARAEGGLAAQLPSLARNAATMYTRAGEAERAQALASLADQLES